MNDMLASWWEAVVESFDQMWTSTAEFVPLLLGAVLLLVVGLVVARIARWGMMRLTTLMRLDTAAERGRLSETLAAGGVTTPISTMLGTVAYWLVILGFALSAARMLGWMVLADSISSLFAWLPNVFAAIIVLAVFVAASRVVRDLVTAGLSQFSPGNARQLGSVSEVLVVLFGVLLSVAQLGFDVSLLTTNVTILLAGFVAAGALAFGLGARGVIANLIGGYYVRQMVSAGDELTVGETTGTITMIGRTAVAMDTEGGVRYVPHSAIIEEGAGTGTAA